MAGSVEPAFWRVCRLDAGNGHERSRGRVGGERFHRPVRNLCRNLESGILGPGVRAREHRRVGRHENAAHFDRVPPGQSFTVAVVNRDGLASNIFNLAR